MPRPHTAKDALLAWAYRRFCRLGERGGRQNEEGEFLFACEDVMPEITGMISDLPDTPLEAVQRAKEEQDRLASEIWETKT